MADWEAPGTFDPSPPTTRARLRADTLVFGRLWLTDPAGRRLPDLASAVPRPSRGAIVVTLRRRLLWSDGTPLTAADVVRSCAAQCAGVTAVAVGRDKVRFATADLRRLDLLFITPARPTGQLASGPFMLTAASTTELRFVRNPHYHGPRPLLAEIDEVRTPSHDAMVFAAIAGEFDYLPHLGPADLSGAFGPLRPEITTSSRVEALVPHDLDVREAAALSLAASRPDLSAAAFAGRAAPVGGPESLSLARWLLAGRHVEVTLRTLCDDPVRDQEAATLAMRWGALGVSVRRVCDRLAELLTPAAGPSLALYADEGQALPPNAIPLLRWPEARAVSPHLHGLVPNDTSATDLWNVEQWWLS
ncbi:MAG TPA: hypothetical protein VF137_00390 [Candidatus Dormibacteraeota bacterium]